MKFLKELVIIILVVLIATGCATKKKKSDEDYGKIKEVYHNMSSKYNGYWNAEQLMIKAHEALDQQHQADYTEVLEVYPYTDVENASVVANDMDIVMKKMARIVKIHPKSDWIDDTYVMLGKAQFLKQDFETAEETFLYFEEEFNPNDPNSRLYQKSKNKRKSAEEKKKKREAEKKKERKIKEENMKKAKKEKEESREDRQDAKEERRNTVEKYKKDIKGLKDDLRKATKKRKDKEKKAREAARKKKQRIKKDPNADPRSAKEIELENKLLSTEEAYKAFLNPVETPKEEESKDEIVEEEVEQPKKKEKKKIYQDDPKGLFKGKLAFHEGVFWLARTFIERENYFAAEYLFRQLENDYPTKKEIRELIPAARAHMYIRQKEYDNAVPHLKSAITNEKSKTLKARYAYILGQIHQQEGRESEARSAFASVNKFKPSYELRFNSQLNLAKASWKSGQNSKQASIRTLNKMLDDRKNDDYQDQIYFTIGDIEEKDGSIEEAILAYQASIQSSSNNKKQQLESYYRIARLLFDKEEYVRSSTYYDSTMTVIEKTDSRYFEVRDYSKSLKSIAANIKILELQDSLLMLSKKSPEELEELFAEIVETQFENQEEAEEGTGTAPFKSRSAGIGRSSSNFFAYDETLVLAGQQIFQRKWGQRALTDDWRRSNRLGALDIELEEVVDENNDEELKAAAIKSMMASVPTTIDKKATVNAAREKALFDLGIDFKKELDNNEKSIEALNTLLRDYPNTKNEPEALFYLYLTHQDLGELNQAAKYKQRLIEKYPNARFSQSMTNPNFAEEQNKDKNKSQIEYAQAYDNFQVGKYQVVYDQAEEAKNTLEKKHPLLPKFALLQAMSVGSLKGKEDYIQSLQTLIARYPNTPEETRAKEILRFIRGDSKAFDSRLYNEDHEDFTRDDDKLHYIVVVLYDWSEAVLQDAKIKISNYNKQYHQLEKLRISDLPLNKDEGTQLILVRKFRNKDKAMKYYDGTLKNSADFLDPSKAGFDIFAATQKNYREIAKKKGVVEYRGFFDKYYVNESEGGK